MTYGLRTLGSQVVSGEVQHGQSGGGVRQQVHQTRAQLCNAYVCIDICENSKVLVFCYMAELMHTHIYVICMAHFNAPVPSILQ